MSTTSSSAEASGSSRQPAVAAGRAPTESIAGTAERLRATFREGRTAGAHWRAEQLRSLERMIEEREAELVRALAADLGRPPVDAWLADLAPVRAESEFARKRLRRWMLPRPTRIPLSVQPGLAWYRYEPLGTVLVIGPWNYPVHLTLSPLVAALAAGNCAVVKPSEHAPESSALLARLLPEYLDSGAVAVVEGAAEETQALLDQGFDHAFFTGNPNVGRRVMEAAAKHLTPVTLELGGKSPVIVTRDADLEVAGRRIAWTKLMNSGQTCVAPDYVLVDRAVQDELVSSIRSSIETLRAGEPAEMRIVNGRQASRLRGLLDDTGGGTTVAGGHVDAEALTVEPTIVLDPDPQAPVMQQEIFGPILPVLGVESLDEAIGFVTARPKPLAAYLFSSSRGARRRVAREISSGAAVINHLMLHNVVPQLPYGGVGASGMGQYHGKWGFETFSHPKAVLSKPARPDPSVVYPPYTAAKKKLLRRFF